MQTMSKSMGWFMLALNVVLLVLIATMHNMAAMWLMGIIMSLDAISGLVSAYHADREAHYHGHAPQH